MNSDLWPGTHSVPCGGGEEGELNRDWRRPTVYPQSMFYLWTSALLAVMTSVLNVVTWTVFLRILYNIYMQYNMNWFFFISLPTLFFSFLFNCLYLWHVWSLLFTNKHVRQIYFRHQMLLWGCSLYVVYHDSDDSWKPRSRCWTNVCWMSLTSSYLCFQ